MQDSKNNTDMIALALIKILYSKGLIEQEVYQRIVFQQETAVKGVL